MYAALPGVHLFRRPADATFMIGGLTSIIGGYLVHRLVIGAVPAAGPRQRICEVAVIVGVVATGLVIAWKQGQFAASIKPVSWAIASLLAAALVALAIVRYRKLPAELALVGIVTLAASRDVV